jgi:hypothetical protein
LTLYIEYIYYKIIIIRFKNNNYTERISEIFSLVPSADDDTGFLKAIPIAAPADTAATT